MPSQIFCLPSDHFEFYPPQRKTGGRGEQIDLEKQFRVRFNDNSEMITQFHLINKYFPRFIPKPEFAEAFNETWHYGSSC